MQADPKTSEQSASPGRPPARAWKISLAIAGLLLAALAIAVIWLVNDTERVKELTERTVSNVTGRPLTIGGAFDFHLGKILRVSADKLTWATASWSAGPPMLSIGSAELSIDLLSILQPPLRISRIAATDAQLNFEWSADGQSNWLLDSIGGDSNAESKPFKWLLETADLQNVDVSIKLAAQSNELNLHLQKLTQKQSDVDLYPGQEMSVTVTGLSATNPSWTNEPELLKIAALAGTFDFDSIITAPLVISDLSARDAALNLEWDADGRFNWQLGATDNEDKDQSTNPLPLVLDKANLQNLVVHIRHPSQDEPVLIAISNGVQQQDKDGHLTTDIDATVDGQPVTLDGRIGPFPELLVAGAVDFDITVKGPGSTLNFEGDVANLARMEKPNVRLEWSAPEVEKIFELFNFPAAASGKADLRGSITPVGDGIEGRIEGSVGEFLVNGLLETKSVNQLEGLSLEKLNGLSVNLKSSGPSAAAAGKVIAIDGLPTDPYELDVKMEDTAAGLEITALRFATAGAQATGSGLLHDFPALTRLDFDLQMKVPDIARFAGLFPDTNVPSFSLTVDGKIRGDTNGENDSVSAALKLGPMDAQLDGTLTEKPRFADSRFDWTLAAPDASKAGAIFGLKMLQSAALKASGKSTVTIDGLSLQETVVNLGPHTVRLNGSLPFFDDDQQTELSGDISGSNLSALVNLFAAVDHIPTLPYDINGQYGYGKSRLTLRSVSGNVGSNKLKASGSLLFGNALPATDLQLSVNGPRLEEALQSLELKEIPTGEYTANGALKIAANGTDISQLELQTTAGKINGSINFGWPSETEKIGFDVTGRGTNLRNIMPAIEGYEPAEVAFDFVARGNIVKDLAEIAEFSATLGSANVNLKGALNFGSKLSSEGAVLKASGPKLSELGNVAWAIPDMPFDVLATLSGSADGLRAEDFRVKIGPSDLKGRLAVKTGGKPNIKLDVVSNLLDLRRFEEQYDETAAATSARTDAAAEKRSPERVIPATPVPTKLLNSLDADVKIDAKKLITQRTPFEGLHIEAKLANGNLDVSATSSFPAGGNVNSSLNLRQEGAISHVELAVTARDVSYDLEQLDKILRGNNLFQKSDAYLSGRGTNLQEIASTLNGFIWLRGGGQQIPTNQFGFLFGDFFADLFSTINPFAKKDPYQNVVCLVAFSEITDGILKTAPAFFMQTDKVNVGATGSVNLKNEKISLDVNANPRKGIGISASGILNPFIDVEGTLAKPRLGINKSGALIDGGAAIVTGGLSIFAKGLFNRWFSAKDPCGKLSDEARAILVKSNPDHVPAD